VLLLYLKGVVKVSKHLNDKQRTEVITDFAAGKTKSDIARKFNVSPNAISKILNKFKSSKNNEEVQSGSNESSKKQDNYEIAKTIIDKAMSSVVKDIEKASPMDRIKIVERLMFLYGSNENEKSKLEQVVDALNRITEL
jgi:transposase-like protein